MHPENTREILSKPAEHPDWQNMPRERLIAHLRSAWADSLAAYDDGVHPYHKKAVTR